MFKRNIISKIKLLTRDKELQADQNWLNKSQEKLRQFMLANPSVRKVEQKSRYKVGRVNFVKLNVQKTQKFAFLGLRLKPMPIIVPILIIALLAGGGITTVQAQDALPGETLYPVKMVTEKVQLAFSDQEGDVELHTKFASRRAEELEALVYAIEMPRPEGMELEGSKYKVEMPDTDLKLIEVTATNLKQEIEFSEKGLTQLEQKGKNVTELALGVEEATSHHLQLLEQIAVKVPAQALSAIEQAKQVSQQGQITAMSVIIKGGEKGYTEEIKPVVEQRITTRLEQTKKKLESIQTSQTSQFVPAAGSPAKIMPVDEPILLELETQIKQIDESIQKSETSLDIYDLPTALKEVKDANIIINELKVTIPTTYDSSAQTTISSENIEKCVQEGEKGPLVPGSQCCPGLISKSPTTPEHNCEPVTGAFVCTRCGNGICGPGENICNCPEDCIIKTELIPYGNDGIIINTNQDQAKKSLD